MKTDGLVTVWGWLCEHQAAAFGLRDRVAELLGRIDPQLDGVFDIDEGVFVAIPMGHATRKLGHFANENLVFFAPVKDDFVFRYHSDSLC